MFIDEQAVVPIKVYYRRKNRTYEAYTESELRKLIADRKKIEEELKKSPSPKKQNELDQFPQIKEEDYMVLELKMRELNWGLYNELQEDGTATTEDGRRIFDYKQYKENKLRKLIVQWSAEKDGKGVPINEISIKKMSPDIAEAILRAYDEENMIEDEEEKK